MLKNSLAQNEGTA